MTREVASPQFKEKGASHIQKNIYSAWNASKTNIAHLLNRRCQQWRGGVQKTPLSVRNYREISHNATTHTGKGATSRCRSPASRLNNQLKPAGCSSAASSPGRTRTGWLDEEGPPGCVCSAGTLGVHRQVAAPVRWGGTSKVHQSVIRPATRAARWFSCSLRRQPGSSSPALRAASACPSDPCGTPAPPGGGTSSSSPAPADFSAQNWFNGLVTSKAWINSYLPLPEEVLDSLNFVSKIF